MAASSPREAAARLINILNTRGQGDYIGEPISQLAHSLQAAHLAKENNADDEMIIAALLHDIGMRASPSSNTGKPLIILPQDNSSLQRRSVRLPMRSAT